MKSPKISSLYNSMVGPIAIIGGGNNRITDYLSCPDGCKVIGVNEHAFTANIKMDFIFFQDTPKRKPRIMHAYMERDFAIVLSTIERFADYVVWPLPRNLPYSGMIATYIASRMTSGKVYLCGMDCYIDDTGQKVQKHVDYWMGVKKQIDSPTRVVAMSGILKTVFN